MWHSLEECLAAENRRVLSAWRAVVLLRRATQEIPAEQRRWVNAPLSIEQVRPILERLRHSGELEPLPKLPFLYRVTSPYARTAAVEEEEILIELHPYATLSHLSAFAFHQMTDMLSKDLHASIPNTGSGSLLPPGTKPEDWQGMALIRGRTTDQIFDRPVHWHRLVEDRLLGTAEYSPHGYPVRVTTPERTLLDGLLRPEWCGGLVNVLKAWAEFRDLIAVETLIEYVEQLDIAVLRQRAGFILEELGISHPTLASWPERAQRGGSSKLSGSAPFAPTYSERWKLSINSPTAVLHGGES